MKLMHLSDLHLGKRVNEYSMLEDQEYILAQILRAVSEEKPDAVLIAGDVYDKPLPPAEAVELFDDFLVQLVQRGAKVFVISGNHDSPERIAFGSRLIDRSGVYLSPVYNGSVTPVKLEDEYGPVHIYLLPFLKPVLVRRFFPDAEIETYTDALRTAITAMQPDPAVRSVLVTHQFVTGAARSESEELSVGGADNVDAAVFAPFDYVALGHLHNPQNVGSERIRYCGTPLKYSFSEAHAAKSITLAELGAKGSLQVRTRPLQPQHDLCELRGRYDELTRLSYYENTDYRSEYLHITLTDEEDIPEAAAHLRVIYPLLMRLDYDNQRTRAGGGVPEAESGVQQSPLELFAAFYEKQNHLPLSDEQRAFAEEQIRAVWEDKE